MFIQPLFNLGFHVYSSLAPDQALVQIFIQLFHTVKNNILILLLLHPKNQKNGVHYACLIHHISHESCL